MILASLLAFVYGVVGGALFCMVFPFYVFKKIERVFADMVRERALKHASFDAVAKRAAVVPPAKAETLCKMACFNDGILGDAVVCRMVFYSSTIDIYQVDELRTLPDHREEVVSEHFLGRINRTCVIATTARISRYHRHHNRNTPYAPIKGRCTVLLQKDDMPLFIEDPNVLLKRRLRAAKEAERQSAMMMHSRSSHGGGGGGAKSGDAPLEEVPNMVYGARCEGQGYASTKLRGSGGWDNLMDVNTAPSRRDGEATRPSALSLRTRRSGGAARLSRDGLAEGASGSALPLSEWKRVAIKFPTRRVQERWLNLLQSTPQSAQWRDFIAHLPQFDVFNLVVARLFFENSRANALHDLLEDKIKRKLARVSKSLPPKLRGNIYLDSLDVGGEIPLIMNVSDPAPSRCGDTEFDFDVLYRGGLALKIRFAVLYREIRVPDIVFSIKVLELAGHMRFVVGPPPTRKFWLGGPKPPQLRLEFTQEVASQDGILNTVLKLLPDMSQFASNVVKVMLFEDMVFPNMDDFPWPVLGETSGVDGDGSPTSQSDAGSMHSLEEITVASLGTLSQHSNAGQEDQPRRSCGTPSSTALKMNDCVPGSPIVKAAASVQSPINLDDTWRSDRSGRLSGISSPPSQHSVTRSAPTSGGETSRLHTSTSYLLDSDRDSGVQYIESPLHSSSLERRLSALSNHQPSGLPPRPPRVASSDFIQGGSITVPASRLLGSSSRSTEFSPRL